MTVRVDEATTELAARVLEDCRSGKLRLAVAESCTGGLISAILTSIPGSSDVVERSFVTYANEAKTEMLGVSAALLAAHGAVSEPVARAMAEGALAHSRADLTGAVTGIAGPGGGSAEKPVGLVHMAVARRGGATRHHREVFAGDRDQVRLQAAASLLGMLLAAERGA
jgi:nicotinamide-nucleotide amidase